MRDKQAVGPCVPLDESLAVRIERIEDFVYHCPGDANLDGKTDVRDFNIWNSHKFTSGTDWTSGDFDGNGKTDVRDFNVWNEHKFTSAPPLPPPVDATLEQMVDSLAADQPVPVGNLAWLQDLVPAEDADGPAKDGTPAEAAVDRLLATFWL